MDGDGHASDLAKENARLKVFAFPNPPLIFDVVCCMCLFSRVAALFCFVQALFGNSGIEECQQDFGDEVQLEKKENQLLQQSLEIQQKQIAHKDARIDELKQN
jgi:hypothetical protein